MSTFRNLARRIARENMKKAGLSKVAKHSHNQGYAINGKRGETEYVNSWYAKHWREFVINM